MIIMPDRTKAVIMGVFMIISMSGILYYIYKLMTDVIEYRSDIEYTGTPIQINWLGMELLAILSVVVAVLLTIVTTCKPPITEGDSK